MYTPGLRTCFWVLFLHIWLVLPYILASNPPFSGSLQVLYFPIFHKSIIFTSGHYYSYTIPGTDLRPVLSCMIHAGRSFLSGPPQVPFPLLTFHKSAIFTPPVITNHARNRIPLFFCQPTFNKIIYLNLVTQNLTTFPSRFDKPCSESPNRPPFALFDGQGEQMNLVPYQTPNPYDIY